MALTLAILSLIIVAFSIYGVLLPQRLVEVVRRIMSGRPGLWIAVAVRLLLAAVLWFTAPVSLTPTIFKVLAVLMVIAAVAIPIVGLARLGKLMDYLATWPQWAVRLGCLCGVAFGGFLLWSISSAIGAG